MYYLLTLVLKIDCTEECTWNRYIPKSIYIKIFDRSTHQRVQLKKKRY